MERWRRLGMLVGALGAVCLAGTTLQAQGAVIGNGTVQLGVNDEGNLNFNAAGFSPYGGVGVRDQVTGYDGTFAGCECEGWGAGISGGAFDGLAGGANDAAGTFNVNVVSFTSTATSATSVVTLQSGGVDVLRVTHLYEPSPETPNLYRVTVTLENVSGGALGSGDQGLRYRRVMDWDVPFPGNEVVTLRGNGATNLIRTSSNGFANSNVFGDPGSICGVAQNTDFVDVGPCDHGALFDFAFPSLATGSSRTFTTFYGVAPSVDGIKAAFGAVGAEVYSYAFCEDGRNPGGGLPACGANGSPSTFGFGFEGVGGTPIEPPPDGSVVPEPGTVLLTATGLFGVAAFVRRRQRRV